MDAAPPPVDVDMAPDDLASLAAPVTTDLAMEEDLAVGPAGDEDGQMAVSDDEEAGGHDELVMEDLAGEPPAPVVDGGEAAMQLEPSDEPKLAGVEDVSFEVEDADATPEVEVLSQPSPAAAAAASPALPVVGEATEVVELSDAPAVEDAVVDAVAEAASPATESFELVEAPSDAEEELEAAPATETATEDASVEVVEIIDGGNDEAAPPEKEHLDGELEVHDSHSDDHAHGRDGDSSSISSSQAGSDAETALFSISERSSQMPVTISYQRINVDVDAEALQTVTCALFQPSDLPSSSTARPLKVILEAQQSLFDAPLIDLFDALREEAAFANEAGLLDIEDEEGTREWVLEHLNEAVCLSVGEDNISARDFTLADLANVHQLCELPEPLQLRLRPGNIRFKQRIEMIKGMRDVMDGEESAADVDELEEAQAGRGKGGDADGDEMEHDDYEHAAAVSDGGYVESGDEDQEVDVRPDYEQGGDDVDELDEGSEDDDEVTEIVQPYADDAAESVDDPTHDEVPPTDDAKDYPNGPDDADVPFDQVNDAPAGEVEVDAAQAEDTTDFALEPTVDNETGILSDSKIVETANGDLEVPAAAHHVETALGSFDEAEATLQVGDNGVLAVDESALEPTEVSDEAANLAREVEEEAAADSTAGGLAEPVPVPTQFAHSAEDDPEALLVIEEADLEKEIGTQSDASSTTQAAKRKRPEPETSPTRRSTRTASVPTAVATTTSAQAKPAALARTSEDELYDDMPAPTPAPALALAEADEVIELDGDSDDGDGHQSDHTLADSDLIVIGEDEDAAAEETDDAGDDEDRDAKRLRTD